MRRMTDRANHKPGLAGSWGNRLSKQVAWWDPMATAATASQQGGREFLQGIIDGRYPPPPFAELVGAELLEVGEGTVRFACVPDESSYNTGLMVHGGLLCTLMDFAAGCAVQTLLGPGHLATTAELKVTFLRLLRAGQSIEVEGRSLKRGRHLAFSEASAHDSEGELVGRASATFAINQLPTANDHARDAR